jgi:acetate kinase
MTNMIILVLNCGSSSVKYSLFSIGSEEKRLARGSIDRIGFHNSRLIQESRGSRTEYQLKVRDHSHAISQLLDMLLNVPVDNDSSIRGILPSLNYIDAVGHRVVHGGDRFASAARIDDSVLEFLRGHLYLAPLHNPPNLAGIEAISRLIPRATQVAVFDTAFHQTLPPHACIYALPYELSEKYRIRRYGFHGISHRFVAQEAARIMKRPPEDLRLITCHLGNGSSIAAVKHGRSVDTTMGFTPLEGLAMGTRCGDLDPAIVLFLQDQAGLNHAEISDLLNRRSGMAGLSGCSSDMREILRAVYLDDRRRTLNNGNPHHKRSKLALDVYVYRIKKYIGAYAAAMGGVDAVVFTGGIGQSLSVIQEDACKGLEFMGVEIGTARSLGNGCYCLSKLTSGVKVLMIPTDEELMIARDALEILRSKSDLNSAATQEDARDGRVGSCGTDSPGSGKG